MSTVWVLQHARCEVLGIIAAVLESVAVSSQYIRTFEGQSAPKEMGEALGLVVMGGPMGVYEHPRHPFLLDEMRLIEQALGEGKPVLGVCLGSQLLAATLGAAVTKGERKEIGWYPVTLTDSAQSDPLLAGVEPSFTAYVWHGDIFGLPHGAAALASSEQTLYQAFRYGRNAYGFLFHMEVTEEIIEGMVREFTDELREAGADGLDIIGKARDYLPPLHKIGGLVFRRWANMLTEEAS